MNRILAIDVGTQSLRACVFDRDFIVLEKQQISYAPQVKAKNWVEIDAEVLWNAFIKACRQLKGGKEIEAISFSTLCPSLVPMDSEGNLLAPMILHLDRRSYRQAIWALGRVGEDRFLRIAGNLPIPGGISLTSLLWLKENEPSVYHRRDVIFGHGVTLFVKRLTGRFFIDPSNASFTGLYDTVAYSDWDDGLLADLEIAREKLPQVAMSTTVVGKLDGKIAASTGLPQGIPVVIGANDTTCAAVGAGITEPGKLMNSTGTVDSMVLCLDRPLTGKNHLLRTHAYPNRWLAMRIVGAGGASVEWFRRTFCQEMSRESFYNEYLATVLSASAGPEARFHPFLSGDRHRIKQKTGSFTRLSLSTTREDYLLALAYGIVSFQAEALREWRKKVPLDHHIYHVGGGASEAYTQYKQRLLKDFRFIQLGETSLKGAAKLGVEALERQRGE
ncbi:MAG: FGGY-family carbohydrate kinase [Thermodesulfobacteriota bacterium]